MWYVWYGMFTSIPARVLKWWSWHTCYQQSYFNIPCLALHILAQVMWHAAELAAMHQYLPAYGFPKTPHPTVNLGHLKRERDVYVARLSEIYRKNLASSGVTLIHGRATFVGPHTVRVDSDEPSFTIEAEHVLIATGGSPALPGVEGRDLTISSDGFFDLDHVPRRLAGAVTLIFVHPRLQLHAQLVFV